MEEEEKEEEEKENEEGKAMEEVKAVVKRSKARGRGRGEGPPHGVHVSCRTASSTTALPSKPHLHQAQLPNSRCVE